MPGAHAGLKGTETPPMGLHSPGLAARLIIQAAGRSDPINAKQRVQHTEGNHIFVGLGHHESSETTITIAFR